MSVPSLNECRWYHTMDLPEIGTVHGDWDLRGRFDSYTGNVPLTGRTVLDVGTASGFLAFEAEKRGATVYSFDADAPERIQLIPQSPRDDAYFWGMRNSYRLAHHLLNSKVTPLYGDIYHMSQIAPPCDVVIVGQILVHLRDPIGAIQQAATLAKDHLIITESTFNPPARNRLWRRFARWKYEFAPISYFLGAHISYAWWNLSVPVYTNILTKLGFTIIRIATESYISHGTNKHQLTTIVSRRKRATSGTLS